MLKKLKQRREYKKKYKRELHFDEKLVYFAAKIIGSLALLFIVAIGVDVYHLFH